MVPVHLWINCVTKTKSSSPKVFMHFIFDPSHEKYPRHEKIHNNRTAVSEVNNRFLCKSTNCHFSSLFHEMEVIFVLPKEVLRCQLWPFFSLKELVNLDTANCNKVQRTEFLRQLDGVSNVGTAAFKSGPSVLKWLSNRGMSLENIFLSDLISNQMFIKYGTVFARTVRCGFSSGSKITSRGFLAFVDNCPNLERLYLTGCQHFSSRESIAYLASHCVKLHTLHVGDT